jgi:tetratricopeptide (TPR) repeat protein
VAKTCDDSAACVELASQALELAHSGQLEAAQQKYEQAYALQADPKILYNLARVLHKGGRPAAAVAYYQRYLEGSGDGNEEQRQKARQYLEQAQREAASLQPVPPSSILLNTSPGAATNSSADASRRSVPVYRKWWFWTVVGVAAAGIATGVALGVYAKPPDLSGVITTKLTPSGQ